MSDAKDIMQFLGTPLDDMSDLALRGERAAAAQALESAGDDDHLRAFLRRRVEECESRLGQVTT